MTILRLDHTGAVVDDLDGAIAFFVELGMEIEGQMPLGGPTVDALNTAEPGCVIVLVCVRVHPLASVIVTV